jgi:hypothetical protein
MNRNHNAPSCPSSVRKLVPLVFLIFLIILPTFASDREDAAADVVSAAFMHARQAAHLSKLKTNGQEHLS